MWLGLLGSKVIGGEIQGVPKSTQVYIAEVLAANMHTYFFLQSGERFWEDRMTQMLDKTILGELVSDL